MEERNARSLEGWHVKVVPPLEPLAARTVSPRFLSEDERVQIADLAARGMTAGVQAVVLAYFSAVADTSRDDAHACTSS